ncbi:MAG TPA: iron-containing alcohol dehydrogenase [Gammaproteobacteria bacterium]|nr:iron-containing alcohol dehydrogenase [Gammaproteobacteria bacterium]
MKANWNYPTTVWVGEGRLVELASACKVLGIDAPLLVTDAGLVDSAMVAEALLGCTDAGLRCGVFSAVKPNPSGTNVEQGVLAYREGQHDGVIAMGGGSGIDAAKAIALMAGHNGSLWDFEDVGDNWRRANAEVIPPIVAIPTTAGTGTEVGRAAVIVNEARESKTIIFHPKLLPSIVILDPKVTVSLPMHLTAATGMDALSHSLEAFCSPLYHPMAEGIALEGIRLVKEFLFTAVTDGGDLEARTQMLVASTMGATAFQRGLGAMHALAHPLGAIFDAHHGTLNAILMPYVLKANRRAITGPMRRLSRHLGLGETGVDGVLEWVLQLREALTIPVSLAAIGIDDRVTDRIGQLAVSDPSAATNPIVFSPEQYRQIFLEALGQ